MTKIDGSAAEAQVEELQRHLTQAIAQEALVKGSRLRGGRHVEAEQDPQQRGPRREGRIQLRDMLSKASHTSPRFDVGVHADDVADERPEREVRRRRSYSAQRDRRIRKSGDRVDQLFDEPRLAEAGLAGDFDDRAAALARLRR